MGAHEKAENTPNAPKFIFPNFLPKSKSLGFRWKKGFIGRPISHITRISRNFQLTDSGNSFQLLAWTKSDVTILKRSNKQHILMRQKPVFCSICCLFDLFKIVTSHFVQAGNWKEFPKSVNWFVLILFIKSYNKFRNIF